MESYAAALISPFDRKAIGSQIPDPYSFPTETQFIRQEFLLQAPATGNWDCVIMPNIYQSMLASVPLGGLNVAGTTGGVSTDTAWQYVSVASSALTNTSATIVGCVTSTNASLDFEQYRIVGYGVRIRPLSNNQTIAGRIIVGATPVARSAVYQPNGTNAANLIYQALDLPGLDTSGYISTEMLNMPDSMEASSAYIASQGGIEFRGKMVSPQALSFRPTNIVSSASVRQWGLASNAGATDIMMVPTAGTLNVQQLTVGTNGPFPLPVAGMSIYNTTAAGVITGSALGTITSVLVGGATVTLNYSASIVFSGAPIIFSLENATTSRIVDPNYILNAGWTGLIVRGIGCVSNSFSVEVIYHLEGPPTISTAGALTHGGKVNVHVDAQLLEQVNTYNNSSSSFKYVGSTAN